MQVFLGQLYILFIHQHKKSSSPIVWETVAFQ